MTSRERVRAVLAGHRPDRVPFNFWMDRDRMAELDRLLGANFRVSHYGADVIEVIPPIPWWREREARRVWDGKTSWQIEPLVGSIEEAMDLALPDPDNPALYRPIAEARAAWPDRAIFCLIVSPFEALLPLRLMEQTFLDLVDRPALVHRLLGRMAAVLERIVSRAVCEDIDVLYLAGDIASRNGAMLSPRHLREFVFGYLRPLVAVAHAAGKPAFYHTDGRVMDILDLFLEAGFDGLNPLEPRYHEAREFRRRVGDRLILYGGLDNCGVIPRGTPADVRAHVRDQFDALGRQGRLIFSSHDIPASTPQENIDAMVQEIKACRYESPS